MHDKAEILTLLTEMRGRLDELERLVRFGADHAIPTPLSFKEPEVEDLTPWGYRQFRQTGLLDSPRLDRFTLLGGFVQIAAPLAETQCELASFALSELHRNDDTPAFGLTMTALGDQQDWFAFEFLPPDLDPKAWLWTEWVLKIATHVPATLYSQFILHGQGEPSHVVIGAHEVTEYATFFHFRLDRAMIPSERLADMQHVRLVLSTGGLMVGLSVYAFGIYGRKP
jgi:hypothetical protein